MRGILCLVIIQFFFTISISAQANTDSTPVIHKDSIVLRDSTAIHDSLLLLKMADSVVKKPQKNLAWQMAPGTPFSVQNISNEILKRHPFFGFSAARISYNRATFRPLHGKETIFYVIVFLLLLYALLRNAFPKYFNDLFRLFFRTTIKQRQISEQLIQTPLPSLLLNIFFVIIGGLYSSFVLQHFKLVPPENFWLMSFYGAMALSGIYLIKFLVLRLSGWLFNMQEAAHSYVFIVFVINKMIGVLLLPFLVLLAFAQGDIYSVGLTLSWCLVAVLLTYRLILTYATVRNEVKVNPFHFFLYLCAFEIAPLLLIYKGLLLFFHITA